LDEPGGAIAQYAAHQGKIAVPSFATLAPYLRNSSMPMVGRSTPQFVQQHSVPVKNK